MTEVNPCKCGSKRKPYVDSDDMVPCWAAQCFDCGQFIHSADWTMEGAITQWNLANPKT